MIDFINAVFTWGNIGVAMAAIYARPFVDMIQENFRR